MMIKSTPLFTTATVLTLLCFCMTLTKAAEQPQPTIHFSMFDKPSEPIEELDFDELVRVAELPLPTGGTHDEREQQRLERHVRIDDLVKLPLSEDFSPKVRRQILAYRNQHPLLIQLRRKTREYYARTPEERIQHRKEADQWIKKRQEEFEKEKEAFINGVPGFREMIESGSIKDPFTYLSFNSIKIIVNEEWVKNQKLKTTVRIVIGNIIRETFMTVGESVDKIIAIFSKMWTRANGFTKTTLLSPESKKVFELFTRRVNFAFTKSPFGKHLIGAYNILASHLVTPDVKVPYFEYQNEIVKLEDSVVPVFWEMIRKLMRDLKLDPSFEHHNEYTKLKASVKVIEKLRRDRDDGVKNTV